MNLRPWLRCLAFCTSFLSPLALLASDEEYKFPSDFKWGAATAAYQVEGGNYFCDWFEWERMGRIVNNEYNGDAAKHWDLYPLDFSLAKSLGHNAYRFSIEWSRIEPQRDKWDMEAVAHYREQILEMKKNGLRPYMTILHFTLPRWLVDFKHPERGHFQDPETIRQFEEFSTFAAQQFGDLIDDYWTMNEPNIMALNAFVTNNFPPGGALSAKDILSVMYSLARRHEMKRFIESTSAGRRFVRGLYNMLIAHARAYDAIKKADTLDADGDGKAATVGVVYQYMGMDFGPDRKEPEGLLEKLLYHYNFDFTTSLKTGNIKIFENAGLTDLELEMAGESIKGKLDVLGVNYYTAMSSNEMVRLLLSQLLNRDMMGGGAQDRGSDLLGLKVRPKGLYQVIKEAHERYGWDVMITENGIATTDESFRADYLVLHLMEVANLIRDGVPVKGYFHWSLMDNFEWVMGFGPRFGLIEVDYRTQKRRVRRAGYMYRTIIQKAEIPPEFRPRAPMMQAIKNDTLMMSGMVKNPS